MCKAGNQEMDGGKKIDAKSVSGSLSAGELH